MALASTPEDNDRVFNKLMTPNLTSMFSTIHLIPPTDDCLRAILRHCASSAVSNESIESILKLRSILSNSVADECGVAQLSTRNLIRVVRRGRNGNDNDLYHALSSVFLLDLLPPRQRSMLESIIQQAGIQCPVRGIVGDSLEIVVSSDTAKIGSLVIQRAKPKRPELVPSPNAFDISSHVQIIQDLLKNWLNGERYFLLLGNQGVGKNKIVDRICEIGNFEREYIQLHRDSTIGQLTLTPQLENGIVVWRDSPLIRAVRDGLILVVDEADKAPVEVVSVLKGLVEDGELLLADGRRVSRKMGASDVIPIHPKFSLWILANRPGMPFLGNDFFREVGDCFLVKVISNPDLNSELELLRSYAPTLDPLQIMAIASSFAELRQLSDVGEISYPYSTREAIAVVKHLEKFPSDGVVSALHNVLDFDSFDKQMYPILEKVFQKHGINVSDSLTSKESLGYSIGNNKDGGELRIQYLDPNGNEAKSQSPPSSSMPKFGRWDDNNEPHVGGNQWAGGTGGSDTAGLGGRGGPFRLDRGESTTSLSKA